jgi:FhaA, N-terminal domain/FHA domain
MKEQHIARLEAQLERLVEGAFSHLFGKKIRAQDIAMQLARVMEDGAQTDARDTQHPIAPDHYVIYLHPTVRAQFLQSQPMLAQYLSEHLVELATSAGYRLNNTPSVDIQGDPEIEIGSFSVRASHLARKRDTTAVLQRVDYKPTHDAPHNAQLILQGNQTIPLNQEVITIGRSRDNYVVIDDRSVSRYHVQIRLRFGRYTLFDSQSHSGTYVNDVQIKEHNLQNGDVIRIGNTQIIYLEDHVLSDSQTSHTEAVDSEPPE